MFKIGNTPVLSDSVTELADFMEWMCIISDNNYSLNDLRTVLSIVSDDTDDDERLNSVFDDVSSELYRRIRYCNGNYPFHIEANSLSFKDSSKAFGIIYVFMLLATRLNMMHDKISKGYDGTALFEQLSSIVAKNYFGDRSDSFVFGTGNDLSAKLENRFNRMSKKIGEGGVFVRPEHSTHKEKDLKLDVVVWKSFSDGRKGKLVGFGQCKTGTNWDNFTTQLNPSSLLNLYSSQAYLVDPIRMFFVSESCKMKWEQYVSEAGILFDRCRIMDYLPDDLDAVFVSKIKDWITPFVSSSNN